MNDSSASSLQGPEHLPAPEMILRLREFTAEEPLRLLVSGCLYGTACGYDGSTYGEHPAIRHLLGLPNVRAAAFCPEDYSFGTPRELCNITGGDGFDVLDGRARVLAESGKDWTEPMIRAAGAMLAAAQRENIHLAVLMDISAACGSQVIYDGNRALKNYRRGPGVCAALLIRNGYPVMSQRDYRTLALLYGKLREPAPGTLPLLDHHETEWYRDYFGT